MVPDMIRHLSSAIAFGVILVAVPMRAANRPHVRTHRQNIMVWTNDDLDKLHGLGLISVVGRKDDEEQVSAPTPRFDTQDSAWYAAHAAILRDELEHRQEQLREYQQALDDAGSLGKSTSGIDLVGEDFAITPEAGIEILQQRLSETQSELDALEDLARRNGIEPGALRGQ